MRLTLRTLLAYLDELLPGEAGRQLAEQVQASPQAQDLVARRRSLLSSLRLGAPGVVSGHPHEDPNTVAEYLDNHLASDRVAGFEKSCLESDERFAEVSAVHQVLSLMAGTPVEIAPGLRKQLHALGARGNAKPAVGLSDFPQFIVVPQEAQNRASSGNAGAFAGSSHSPGSASGKTLRVDRPHDREPARLNTAAPLATPANAGKMAASSGVSRSDSGTDAVVERSAENRSGGQRGPGIPVTDRPALLPADPSERAGEGPPSERAGQAELGYRNHPGQVAAAPPHYLGAAQAPVPASEKQPRAVQSPEREASFPYWELMAFCLIFLLGMIWLANQPGLFGGKQSSLNVARNHDLSSSRGPADESNPTVSLGELPPRMPVANASAVVDSMPPAANPVAAPVGAHESLAADVQQTPPELPLSVTDPFQTSMPVADGAGVSLQVAEASTVSTPVAKASTVFSPVAEAATGAAAPNSAEGWDRPDQLLAEYRQSTLLEAPEGAAPSPADVTTTAGVPPASETAQGLPESEIANVPPEVMLPAVTLPGGVSAELNPEEHAADQAHSSEEVGPAPLPEETVAPESEHVDSLVPAYGDPGDMPLDETSQDGHVVDVPGGLEPEEEAFSADQMAEAPPTQEPPMAPEPSYPDEGLQHPEESPANGHELAGQAAPEAGAHQAPRPDGAGLVHDLTEWSGLKQLAGDAILVRTGGESTWSQSDGVEHWKDGLQLLSPARHASRFAWGTTGLNMELQGWGVVRLDWDAPTGTPVVRLLHGQVALLHTGHNRLQVQVCAGEQSQNVELAGDSALVASANVLSIGAIPQQAFSIQQTPMVLELEALQGEVHWEAAEQPGIRHALSTGEVLVVGEQRTRPVDANSLRPFDPNARLAQQSQWIERWQRGLTAQDTILSGLEELASSARDDRALVAAQTLIWLGRPQRAIQGLNQVEMSKGWNELLAHLRSAAAQDEGLRNQVRESFHETYTDEFGQSLYRMLWGYSMETAGPETDDVLVAGLDHPVLACRVLCFWNLQEITGATHGYRPDAPAIARSRRIKDWQAALKQNKIRVGQSARRTAPGVRQR